MAPDEKSRSQPARRPTENDQRKVARDLQSVKDWRPGSSPGMPRVGLGAILKLFKRHFGRPSASVELFYLMSALPE